MMFMLNYKYKQLTQTPKGKIKMNENVKDYRTLEEESNRVSKLDSTNFKIDQRERDNIAEFDAKTLALWGGIAIENSGLVELDF